MFTFHRGVKMVNGPAKMSVLWMTVLMLPGLALAQGIQFDLILEKTFASLTEEVGIDYDAQGKPVFTIVSHDRVEVMDSQGNTATIVSGLTDFDWASPSENGRFVGISKASEATDTVTGEPYFKYHFNLKRRNGETVYEVSDCPFNDFRVGNNGAVCGRGIVGIGITTDWRYCDPEGNLTPQFPASSKMIPFGDSGSYLVYHHGDTVSACTGNHTLLWSIYLSSQVKGHESAKVSPDGHYFVRCSNEGTEFYQNGDLVKVDTTTKNPWNRVMITPDGGHAMVVSGAQAYLWNLTDTSLVRIYETGASSSFFGYAASSTNGQYAVLSSVAKDTPPPYQRLIILYDDNAQAIWQTEGPASPLSRPWLTVDPTATYICQRDYAKLWLYRRK